MANTSTPDLFFRLAVMLWDDELWRQMVPGALRRRMAKRELELFKEDMERLGYQFDPPFSEDVSCQLI